MEKYSPLLRFFLPTPWRNPPPRPKIRSRTPGPRSNYRQNGVAEAKGVIREVQNKNHHKPATDETRNESIYSRKYVTIRPWTERQVNNHRTTRCYVHFIRVPSVDHRQYGVRQDWQLGIRSCHIPSLDHYPLSREHPARGGRPLVPPRITVPSPSRSTAVAYRTVPRYNASRNLPPLPRTWRSTWYDAHRFQCEFLDGDLPHRRALHFPSRPR